jgi:hypothetical protein
MTLLETHRPGFFPGNASAASAEPKIATVATAATVWARHIYFLVKTLARIAITPQIPVHSGWHERTPGRKS